MVLNKMLTPRKQRLRRRPRLFPKKTVRLEKQMAVIVPSTKEFNKPVSNVEMNQRVQTVRDFFTEKFGGTTRVRGIGSYSGEKGIVDEDVVVVECFADAPDWNKMKTTVADYLQRKARDWGQENMGFELEGDLFLVEG